MVYYGYGGLLELFEMCLLYKCQLFHHSPIMDGTFERFAITYFEDEKWHQIEIPEALQFAHRHKFSTVLASIQLHFDKTNSLWLSRKPDALTALSPAVNEGFGIFVYEGSEWTHYTTDDGLVSNHIYSIDEGYEGEIWLSTTGGVSRLYEGEWINYTREDGLINDEVLYVYFLNERMFT